MTRLDDFITRLQPDSQHEEIWGPDAQFMVSSYLSQDLPPAQYLTSVRVIVLQTNAVLVITNEHGNDQVVPGGRREAGETLEDTGRREVLEEVGWELGPLRLLGFWHFHRLSPVPPDYPYPVHFAQAIFTAQALRLRAERMIHDLYAHGSRFVPCSEAHSLALSAGERLFLDEAMRPAADGAL